MFDKSESFCPHCGAHIASHMTFCPICGGKINPQDFSANSQEVAVVKCKVDEEAPYVHESDRAALKALQAIPGFTAFLRGFMKIWNERQYKIQNMSSKIRLSDKQFPKYYNMLPPICEKLGIKVPELYLELNVVPNAYTSGDNDPFITITSGLLETVPDELIPTVLAHECGHIACHHVLYHTMGSMIINGAITSGSAFGLGQVISLPLQVAFYYWMRCSELSADRAAAIYNGNADRVTDLCMRLAGYDKDIIDTVDKDLFMQQALEYKNTVESSKWDKTMEFLILAKATHPFTAVRAYECNEWAKTREFADFVERYERRQ